MQPLTADSGDSDRIYRVIEDGRFVGCGDPKKLHTIPEVFLHFAKGNIWRGCAS